MSPMGLRALKEGLAQNLGKLQPPKHEGGLLTMFHVGKLMPIVIDEVVYSLDKEIPACKGPWYDFRLGGYATDSLYFRLDAR